jgi:hypothetical protein
LGARLRKQERAALPLFGGRSSGPAGHATLPPPVRATWPEPHARGPSAESKSEPRSRDACRERETGGAFASAGPRIPAPPTPTPSPSPGLALSLSRAEIGPEEELSRRSLTPPWQPSLGKPFTILPSILVIALPSPSPQPTDPRPILPAALDSASSSWDF